MRGYNERLHWCIFNILVRSFGIIATVFGVAFISSGVYFYNHPREAKKNESEQWAQYYGAKQTFSHKTLEPDLLGGIVTGNIAEGVFIGIIGVAMLQVRPYRPDLGDKVSSYASVTRSWWTGEPNNVSTNPMPSKEEAPD